VHEREGPTYAPPRDSEDQFNAFGETLMPILQEEGIDPGEPDISPVHNVIFGT
jgi:hypothetical protein